MALRVLLADESTTIKKVIQLALQDYGVEVKSVPIGLDVLPVAKSFQPDMIFVDVLLQKKSGYDVAKDLKEDSRLSATPVVLMWSSFMEIDEAKAQASRADARLEKPFDADILRKLVKDLVPRTLDHKISGYLTFPKLPDFTDEPKSPMASLTEDVPAETAEQGGDALPEAPLDNIYAIPEVSESDIQVDVAPEDQFSNVPLSATKAPTAGTEESWSHQDLSKFKIQIPKDGAQNLGADLDKYMIPAEELDLAKVETNGEFEEVTFVQPKPAPTKPTKAPPISAETVKQAVSNAMASS
ncbi:MAG TPA: response regulator, partial [Pseudobdellovibrionaceae bacterium]|nr:response regulator [Pseudobdellovibrionaceae bacterium]